MPKEFQLYEYEISGVALTPHPSDEQQEAPRSNRPDDGSAVKKLNATAGKIALEIEKEVARFLRGSATVHAEVRFYEGSILIEGTVLILSWLGPVALAAGKKAFEGEFSRVVQMAVQRILQRMIGEVAPQSQPLRIDVEPQDANLAPPAAPGLRTLSYIAANIPNILVVYLVLNTILLVMVLLLMLQIRSVTP